VPEKTEKTETRGRKPKDGEQARRHITCRISLLSFALALQKMAERPGSSLGDVVDEALKK